MKFLSKLKLAVLFCLSLLLTLSTLSIQVNANTDLTQLPFYWEAMDVELDVRDNGDMLVTETQTYVFNREHTGERYRYIPLARVDDITDVTVSENNAILPSQTGKENNQLWIRWQHELNPPESHTFVIKYRVIGGIQVNANDAKVHWKAIFSDRQAPIQNARVTIRLPESLSGKINFFNYYADNVRVDYELGDRIAKFIAQKSIPAGKELEVEIGFPNDVLDLPRPKWQPSILSQKLRRYLPIEDILIVLVVSLPFLLATFGISNKPASRSKSNRRSSNHYHNYGGYYGGGSSGGDAGGSCGGDAGGGGGGG